MFETTWTAEDLSDLLTARTRPATRLSQRLRIINRHARVKGYRGFIGLSSC